MKTRVCKLNTWLLVKMIYILVDHIRSQSLLPKGFLNGGISWASVPAPPQCSFSAGCLQELTWLSFSGLLCRGGAELLFDGVKKHQVTLPGQEEPCEYGCLSTSLGYTGQERTGSFSPVQVGIGQISRPQGRRKREHQSTLRHPLSDQPALQEGGGLPKSF